MSIFDVDYFTKWIEAKPLAKITANNIVKFLKNIPSRFRIPQCFVTDNGTQFVNKYMRRLLEEPSIKQYFTYVEHPQTNRLVESAKGSSSHE